MCHESNFEMSKAESSTDIEQSLKNRVEFCSKLDVLKKCYYVMCFTDLPVIQTDVFFLCQTSSAIKLANSPQIIIVTAILKSFISDPKLRLKLKQRLYYYLNENVDNDIKKPLIFRTIAVNFVSVFTRKRNR